MARTRWPLLALSAGVAAYFLIASVVSRSPEEAAEGQAADYLTAVCEDGGDHGWSRLVADHRALEFASRDAYLLQVEQSDCSRFAWQLVDTDCDDEVGVCVLWLSVPDEASIPAVLAQSGIVTYRTDHVPPGVNAGIAVMRQWLVGSGVVVPEA